MKQAFWFKHDENARNDEKILAVRAEFGWEGYAWYFALLEMMSEASDGQIHRVAMAGIAVGLGVPKDRLAAFIDFCVSIELLKEDDGRIYSGRMLSQKAQRQALSQSGRAGAQSRWKEKTDKASASQENGQAMATPMQRRGEEKRKTTVSVRPETESLIQYAGELCQQTGIGNKLNPLSLNLQVERHLATGVHLRVEVRKCVGWLVDHGKKDLTTPRLTNWLEKASEIQKRDRLRQLEQKEALNNPHRKDFRQKAAGSAESDSVAHFLAAQS